MVSILSTQGKKNSPSPRNTTHPRPHLAAHRGHHHHHRDLHPLRPGPHRHLPHRRRRRSPRPLTPTPSTRSHLRPPGSLGEWCHDWRLLGAPLADDRRARARMRRSETAQARASRPMDTLKVANRDTKGLTAHRRDPPLSPSTRIRRVDAAVVPLRLIHRASRRQHLRKSPHLQQML